MSDRNDLENIISDSLPPLQLIPKLAPFITGPYADQALIALSQSLLQYRDSLNDALRQHLGTFLQSVFQFRQQLSPGLAALVEASYQLGVFPDLPAGLSLLSCDPSRRRSFLNALRSALPDEVEVTFIPALLSLIEDETDPPALLASFQLVAEALSRIRSVLPKIESESVFEHCSIYFPITFSGTSCDGDLLRSVLLECLTSRVEMAPFAVPFFLDKLQSTMNQAQMQSFHALSRCMERFPTIHTSPYLSELSARLIDIWAEPSSPPSTLEMSIKALYSTLTCFFSRHADESDCELCSEKFLQPILSVISKRLLSNVPLRSSSAYVQALATLCLSSPQSFSQCYEFIWPILMQRMISSRDPNEQVVASLIVGDTFAKTFAVQPSNSDALKSDPIVDTFLSIADASSPGDLLRSIAHSLSQCLGVVSSDQPRLRKIIQLASSIIQNSLSDRGEKPKSEDNSVESSFDILQQSCLFDTAGVVGATLPAFLLHPDHLQRICILSSEYLRAVLPVLIRSRLKDAAITQSLCSIAKQCSEDDVAALISEFGCTVFGSDDASLFQILYTRCSTDQQLKFCEQYLRKDYINDVLTRICILSRHPETVLIDEADILHVAFKTAIDGNPTACMIVADILNKCQNHDVIEQFLKSTDYFSIDWSSSRHSSLLVWIIKALGSRGESVAFTLASDLLQYRCHLSILPILVDESLPLVSWYILPLYKQRLLCTLLPLLLSSDSYLACLPQLLAHAPRQVLLDYTQQLLPILESSLKTSSAQLSLSTLVILISNDPQCIMRHAMNIVEPLLSLARPHNNTKTRFQALQTLSLLIQHVPADEIYPWKAAIKQTLSLALDDDKRLCRQEAGECLRLTGWQ